MEITGKIIAVLEPRRGTSSRTGSEWICGQYVLETMDQYPRKLFFEVFGADRMQQFNIQMGEIMYKDAIFITRFSILTINFFIKWKISNRAIDVIFQ